VRRGSEEMPDGIGGVHWHAKALAFLASFKKPSNPDKYDADGYD
jgi:hypothetical protein